MTAFEQETGIQPVLSYGSSGKLFAQIRHGAPFDVFLSADQTKPIELEKAGLIVPGSRFTYAEGRLVLWSARITGIGAESLMNPKLRRIALANPRLAPYGRAATDALSALDMTETTRSRWVIGENISQTYMFVDSGNAELGFVAASQVLRDGQMIRGAGWLVPSDLHSPIRQDAVLLSAAEKKPEATRLFEYLSGETARSIMRQFGYRAYSETSS